jgi:hypothetical protein
MSTKKKSNPLYLTPKGRAEWPKLFTPDTKFNPDGDYTCTMVFENADAQDLMAQLDKALEASIAAAAEESGKALNKIKFMEPYEVDDETGDVKVKFKLKAKGKTREGKEFTQKPTVFDAGNRPITKEIPLWNGSVLRVGYQVSSYYNSLVGAGLSLRLKQAQVINAVAGGEATSAFGAEEGGYAYDAAADADAEEAAFAKEIQDNGDFDDDIPF